MVLTACYDSPVGELTLAARDGKLMGLWIRGQKYFLGSLKEETMQREDESVFCRTKAWLDDYFAGKRPEPHSLPLAPVGSEFRRAVWDILLTIGYGETMTYGDVAKEMARQQGKTHMSAQAVGGAVGHNPISIIIPCHRVVGADGSLTGYAGGVGIKERLLRHEGAFRDDMFLPKKGTAL